MELIEVIKGYKEIIENEHVLLNLIQGRTTELKAFMLTNDEQSLVKLRVRLEWKISSQTMVVLLQSRSQVLSSVVRR